MPIPSMQLWWLFSQLMPNHKATRWANIRTHCMLLMVHRLLPRYLSCQNHSCPEHVKLLRKTHHLCNPRCPHLYSIRLPLLRLRGKAFYVKPAVQETASKLGYSLDKFGGAYVGWKGDIVASWATAKLVAHWPRF